METTQVNALETQELEFLEFDSVEEFDNCESSFLAKKYFLLNWILS